MKKMLAAIMVFSMVACCLAFALPATDSDADPTATSLVTEGNNSITVTSWSAAVSALDGGSYATVILDVQDGATTIEDVVISSNYEIKAGKTLIIGNEYYNNQLTAQDGTRSADFTITINEGVTLTVAGTIYNNVGMDKATAVFNIDGKMVFTGSGKLFNVSAPKIPSGNNGVTGFFTSRQVGDNLDQYKQFYAANVNDLINYVIPNTYSNFGSQSAIFSYGDVGISASPDFSGIENFILYLGGVGKQNASITIAQDVVISSKIVNAKDNSAITTSGVKAGVNGIVLTQGSIVIGGDVTVDGTATITVNSGTAKLTGDIPANMTVTIAASATLEVPADADITVGGRIVNNGTFTNNGAVQLNGTFTNESVVTGNTIQANANATIGGSKADAVPTTAVNGKTGIGTNILAFEGDVIIEGDAYLIENVEIPAEKKLIIRSTGSLDLHGKNLTINGEFIIEGDGKVYGYNPASTPTNTIYLMKGASIINDGIIGADSSYVTVTAGSYTIAAGFEANKYYGVGAVTLKNGSGVEFGLVNTTPQGDSIPTYTLTVTGNIYSMSLAKFLSPKQGS